MFYMSQGVKRENRSVYIKTLLLGKSLKNINYGKGQNFSKNKKSLNRNLLRVYYCVNDFHSQPKRFFFQFKKLSMEGVEVLNHVYDTNVILV